ncbi:helix-turn-helix domain-containing protein [Martelella lutilitoris]|uniref:Helix-turn-helix domain-containing protein n=1 Tax=Martelella lutilitoris TaxID=2583532 RepID=A0A7T7KKW8_9HYPH|nr:GcrA family cell cycle regulator [Martelella lutilitoris]QQM29314.1 helix-turn-helix domain-containing protein [Martelella lutilitoris]
MNQNAIQQASKLWANGLSVSQIAQELGTTNGTIAGMSKRNRDLFPQRRQGPTPADTAERDERIFALWAEGHGQCKIAEIVGCHPTTVKRLKTLRPEMFPARKKEAPVSKKPTAERPDDGRRYGDARKLQVPGTEPIPLTQCGPFRCKLPLTDRDEPAVADVLCCGQPVLAGTSACSAHYRILYRPKRELEEV